MPGILNLNRRLISVELAVAGKRSSGDMSQDVAGGDRPGGQRVHWHEQAGGQAIDGAALL
ncbi:hypothetical protein CXK90_17550 [Stutzerimonas stutzeri]|nr:hypothetical protein CXK90_17550 [Stutzerimonas stutzeri]